MGPTEKKSLTLEKDKKKRGFFNFRSKKDKYTSDSENKKYTKEEKVRKKYTPLIRRYSQRQAQRQKEQCYKKQTLYDEEKPGCYKPKKENTPRTELQDELNWWDNAHKQAKAKP